MDSMIGLMPPLPSDADPYSMGHVLDERLHLVEGSSWPSYTRLEEKFDAMEAVGSGGFETVYKARDRSNGRVVTIKNFAVEDDCPIGIPSQVLREVALLRGFKHPNIIELVDMIFTGAFAFTLVFAYEDNDLHQMLKGYRKQEKKMPMEMVRKYTSDLLNGLHACHSRMIVHRDLKPQKLLIGKNGLKIADFDLSRTLSLPLQNYTLEVITLWYRPPEILLGCLRYGPEVDVWSTGCVFSEMVIGGPIFMGDSEIGTLFKQFAMLGTPTEDSWPGLSALAYWKPNFPKFAPTDLKDILRARPEIGQEDLDLLRGLLAYPAKRITSRRAKNIAFAQSLNMNTLGTQSAQ